MSTNELKKTTQNKRLISKKEILEIAIMLNNFGFKRDELKKMKVNDLRQLCKITHIIDGKFRDMRGYCFGCLTSLRHDYMSNLNKNYCLDCL